MPYSYGANNRSMKGVRIDIGDRCILQMQLTDAFNVPIVLQEIIPPETIKRRDLRWTVSERVEGGQVFTFLTADIEILNPDLSYIGLTIKEGILNSEFGYIHKLAIKWPEDPDWNVVGVGKIITAAQPGDRVAQLA